MVELLVYCTAFGLILWGIRGFIAKRRWISWVLAIGTLLAIAYGAIFHGDYVGSKGDSCEEMQENEFINFEKKK
jgi:heme A synthase